MVQLADAFGTIKKLPQTNHFYYSLPSLEDRGFGNVQRLPISIRIILESLLRHCDGDKVKKEDVLNLLKWNAKNPVTMDIPFIVSRVILQDFTGVPLLVDLAAMRDAMAAHGHEATFIEPQVPVDLVVDHSVQVDRAGTDDALMFNLTTEFERNKERYSFLKWGQQAFKTFKVVPPGIGIVHQVNLEHIATVVTTQSSQQGTVVFPDTLVGTDSHTTMINGLGVIGWGVGGIEAEAAMLGQPVSLQTPEVIGVHLTGALKKGVTATDLTLRITELLRTENVVGKFVEYFGAGASSLSVADRATIGNMAPEYGATMGYFPVDDKTLEYLAMTGRSDKEIKLIKEYLQAQGLFGIPQDKTIEFSKVIELDLNGIEVCVSGPKRPQDRIDLTHVKTKFHELLINSIEKGGYGKIEPFPKVCVQSEGPFTLSHEHETGGVENLDRLPLNAPWSESEMVTNRPFTHAIVNPGYSEIDRCDVYLTHGSVVIAAITSCTNTSNPNVMIAAGLLAKKAVEKGLKVNSLVKTSLAPGSRVVTDYLEKLDLQRHLDALGFHVVAYGCTTCIGNSGPLDENLENAIKEKDLIVASVLSGNRNFEARIHAAVKANFLMSPPLVVAYAIAGRVSIDFDNEPLGIDNESRPVYLKDIWPTHEEVAMAVKKGIEPSMFQHRYSHILDDNPVWKTIPITTGSLYRWDSHSTYIQKPPYFNDFSMTLPEKVELKGLRPLAFFGDSVTTDHISPAGAFRATSAAGQYLLSMGVSENDFNSYGSRRGNHHVMMRGTFANVRLRNFLADDKEGGYTKLMPENTLMSIFEASQVYQQRAIPLIIFAGKDYGMGSSRDWAAKGTALLGVRVVVARSFERIHRSNLIGMGVLPLEFKNNDSWESLKLSGTETFVISGLDSITPQQDVTLEIDASGSKREVILKLRLDSMMEVEYYTQGGILPYVLRQQIKDSTNGK